MYIKDFQPSERSNDVDREMGIRSTIDLTCRKKKFNFFRSSQAQVRGSNMRFRNEGIEIDLIFYYLIFPLILKKERENFSCF